MHNGSSHKTAINHLMSSSTSTPEDVHPPAPNGSNPDQTISLSDLNMVDKLVLALILAQGWTESHHDSESPFYGRFAGALTISFHLMFIGMNLELLGYPIYSGEMNWLSDDLSVVMVAGGLALLYGIIHLLTSSNDILRGVQLSEEEHCRYRWLGNLLIFSPLIQLAFSFIWLLGFSGEYWQVW